VFLTVRIRGLGNKFRLHVVIVWIQFDFVLLLLLIYVGLLVKLGYNMFSVTKAISGIGHGFG
jgi:hypothetical protein